jgi:hypothetical protein
MNDILIIDNVISKNEQELIKELLFSNKFAWFFQKDVTNANKKQSQGRPAFSHYFINKSGVNSDYVNILTNIVANGAKKIKIGPDVKILFAKTILQLPLNSKKQKVDTAHIDLAEKHLVFLYYVLDNEAKTIIYKNTKKSKKLIELKKIKPKQGRLVIFNGSHYHTAEQPTKNTRCIINFDISI